MNSELAGQDQPSTRSIPRLVHVEGFPPRVSVSTEGAQNEILVRCPSELMDAGASLLPVVTMLVERELQLAGLMSLQGACVGWPHGGVLILGPSGCGKTTTVMALCRSHAARLVGNDLLVVGQARSERLGGADDLRHRSRGDAGLKVLAGSSTIHVRPTVVSRHHPELANVTHLGPNPDFWTKVFLPPSALGVSVASGPVNLVRAYVVHVDDRLPGLAAAGPPPALEYGLYENLSRYLRATAEPFLGNNGRSFLSYLPGMDSPECHAVRTDVISRIVHGLGVQRVSGPVDEVAAFIAGEARALSHS